MNSINSINYACSLNNEGVDLLVSGESSRARKVFQSALSLLKKADDEADKTTSYTETNVSHNDASLLTFRESTSTVSGLQGLHCYVYDHSIMISGNVNGATDVFLHRNSSFQFGTGVSLRRDGTRTRAITDEGIYTLQLGCAASRYMHNA
jgi:hypothetical protein